MNKIIVSLIALFISDPAFSCAIPQAGPEFDELLDITKLDERGEFYIEVPNNWGEKVIIFVSTYTEGSYELLINGPVKQRLEAGESVPGEEAEREWAASQPIKVKRLWWLKTKNDKVSKKFSVKLDKGLVHIVHVTWDPGGFHCQTDAFSEPLESI